MMLMTLVLVAMANPQQAVPARPLGNPALWVTPSDYPAESLRQEQEGTTSFRLTIDAAGVVTGCDVTASSGHPALDERTCALAAERARFSPARDSTGNATVGMYQNRVRWRIPQARDLPIVPIAPILSAVTLPTGPKGNWSQLHLGTVKADDPLSAELLASPAVPFALEIGIDGSVTRCRVTDDKISAAIADATCQQLDSAKLTPARDIGDQPTASLYKGDFRWRAAGPPVPPAPRLRANRFATGKAVIDFTLGADGRPSNCQVVVEGTNPFGNEPDGPCASTRPIEPFRDADGAAVARDVRLTIAIEVNPAKDNAAPSGEQP